MSVCFGTFHVKVSLLFLPFSFFSFVCFMTLSLNSCKGFFLFKKNNHP